MYKAYKFRMYPSDEQSNLIHKTFECYRLIYNYFLNQCMENKIIKAYDMCNKLKEMYVEYPWLKEVDSCSLRCVLFNLEDAYQNYFSKRNKYPVFKNRFSRQSYRTNCIRSSYKGKGCSNIELDLQKGKIKIPKLGFVDIRGYRNLEVINGKIVNATVIRETTGKYYVSVVVDEIEVKKEGVVPKNDRN